MPCLLAPGTSAGPLRSSPFALINSNHLRPVAPAAPAVWSAPACRRFEPFGARFGCTRHQKPYPFEVLSPTHRPHGVNTYLGVLRQRCIDFQGFSYSG